MDNFTMPSAEIGAVKFFDERQGKQFGFALVLDSDGFATGEEIFFHYNDGCFVYDENGTPVFSQAIKYQFQENGQTYVFDDHGHGYWPAWVKRMWCVTVRMPVPRKGDHIVFRRRPGKGDRPKACPWGFARCERVTQVPAGAVSRQTVVTIPVVGTPQAAMRRYDFDGEPLDY